MEQRSLPRKLEAVLANRFSAAALVVLLFSGAMWLPALLAGQVPILASILAMLLHLGTIILFCCILYGGGTGYALQVGLLATVGVFFISELNGSITFIFLLAYVAIPWLGSSFLLVKDGLNRSLIIISACCCILFIILALVSDVRHVVEQSVALMFDTVRAQQIELGIDGTQEATQKMEVLIVLLLPAALMQVVWFMWLWSMLAARWLALRYQFYTGDQTLMSSFCMHRGYVGMLCLLLIAVVFLPKDNESSGYYISLSLLLFIAGLFSIQGVIVAREWLKQRHSDFAVGVMYVVLFIQPMMLIPLIMVGLLDAHFDYRCIKQKKSGGE